MSYYHNTTVSIEGFVYPPSFQSDLFALLSHDQQEEIRPILRDLKRPVQEQLCCALLDYLEQGDATAPADFLLAAIFSYLTSHWTPLHVTEF